MNSDFDEEQWILHVSQVLEEENEEEEEENPISIFNVPKPLLDIYPQSYIPQLVSIGPFHYSRPEIHDMERFKLASAKRNQKDFKNLKLKLVVEELKELEPRIRANYQKFFNCSSETLAWMMAVDASFLLEFLQVCAVKKNKGTANILSSRLSRLVKLGQSKARHSEILRDITMVENQIPLFVLRKPLEMYFSSSDKADELLFAMLIDVCEELSPFKKVCNLDCDIAHLKECDHLLEFLYRYVVPKLEDTSSLVEIVVEQGGLESKPPTEETGFVHKVSVVISKLHGPVTIVKKVIFSKPVKMIVKLPWTILSNLPVLRTLKAPIEQFVENINDQDNEDCEDENGEQRSPLLDEIEVPSVTQLAESGIRFKATKECISGISFDTKTRTLHLPTINLDDNSPVVLRNLVAYEVCSAPGPLVLARYVELMNGIIDTGEDAKFLREHGIVKNRLKSDDEVAKLWNGMSKSVKLTKVPFLDKVIEDVNKDYNCRWNVKLKKCMKRYIFGSWKILTLLGALMMMLLLALQAFCTVYNCARILPIEDLS